MPEAKIIDSGLRQEMVGTASYYMAQLLGWIHYSSGNNIAPIHSLKRLVVDWRCVVISPS